MRPAIASSTLSFCYPELLLGRDGRIHEDFAQLVAVGERFAEVAELALGGVAVEVARSGDGGEGVGVAKSDD